MKVAYIASGIGEYGLEFAEMLSNDCDATLYVHKRYFSLEYPRPNSRLQIGWLPWPRQRDPRSIGFTWQLAKLIRQSTPDLVHFLSMSAWDPLLLFFLKPLPVVTTVHDITHHPGDKLSWRVPSFAKNMMATKSKAVIVHGAGLRDAAMRKFPGSSGHIFSMPLVPSIRPDDFAACPKPNDGIFRILFFGRIYRYKGLQYLLDAAPLIHARIPNARIIIAGQGEDLCSYDFSENSGIEIRNRYIPREEMAQLFFDADVLALPYIEASQSGPLMIATSFAVPVVATDVGEIATFVRSHSTGIIVPPRDAFALASAIIKLALNKDLAENFARNSMTVMEGVCSPVNMAREVIRIYRNVLDKENS
jgi:glycosyltransferase involved in cell wall biosynthesis